MCGTLRKVRFSNRLTVLPTILLSNVQSIRKTTDKLDIYSSFDKEFKKMSLLDFTETWLDNGDQDVDFNISGFGDPVHMDRSPLITNESTGGGLSFSINQRYCNTTVLRERICTPDLKLLSSIVFIFQGSFLNVFLLLVYIHPCASVTNALQLIADVMNRMKYLFILKLHDFFGVILIIARLIRVLKHTISV